MFNQVAEVIGKRAAQKLKDRFPGAVIYVPVPTKRNDARNLAIRAERASGATIEELVKRYALSRRQVWRVLGAA